MNACDWWTTEDNPDGIPSLKAQNSKPNWTTNAVSAKPR
jgi:hypothetical protein